MLMKDLDRIEKMVAMKLDGKTYSEIAKEFRISRQRVQKIIEPPKEIRKIVFLKAEGRCESCSILTGPGGHIHHIGNSDIDFSDIGNLQLLCPSCHRRAHRRAPGTGRRHENTTVITARIPNTTYVEIKRRIDKNGMTVNQWLNWAIASGLRSHSKRDNNDFTK